jgi:hypothetical protein
MLGARANGSNSRTAFRFLQLFLNFMQILNRFFVPSALGRVATHTPAIFHLLFVQAKLRIAY